MQGAAVLSGWETRVPVLQPYMSGRRRTHGDVARMDGRDTARGRRDVAGIGPTLGKNTKFPKKYGKI